MASSVRIKLLTGFLLVCFAILMLTVLGYPTPPDAHTHTHVGSRANGKTVTGSASNDYSLLYNIGPGHDNHGVVYDRWCNNSPTAVMTKNNGQWRVQAVDHHCFGEGAFFSTRNNQEGHKTCSYRNGRGNWVCGPASLHPQ